MARIIRENAPERIGERRFSGLSRWFSSPEAVFIAGSDSLPNWHASVHTESRGVEVSRFSKAEAD
jgi:hypothetical protein